MARWAAEAADVYTHGAFDAAATSTTATRTTASGTTEGDT
jgi:hypothetical protein